MRTRSAFPVKEFSALYLGTWKTIEGRRAEAGNDRLSAWRAIVISVSRAPIGILVRDCGSGVL
jgi:hypothetical protein